MAFSDTFTRADASSLSSPWTTSNGHGITSNKGDYKGSTDSAWHVDLVDGGEADGEVRVRITGIAGTPDCGVVFRASDTSNFMFGEVVITSGEIKLRLFKRIAGTFTLLGATSFTTNFATAFGRADVRIRFSGTTYTVVMNGILHEIVTVSTGLESNTLCGIATFANADGANILYDDFSVTAIPAVTSLFEQMFPLPVGAGTRVHNGAADSTEYIMGTGMEVDVDGEVPGVWLYVASANQPTNSNFSIGLVAVPNGAGGAGETVLVNETATAPVSGDAGTWKYYPFSSPEPVSAGDLLYPCVRLNRYAYAGYVFDAADIVNGDLRGWQNAHATGFPNGAFEDNPTASAGVDQAPFKQFNRTFYGVDIEFTPGGVTTHNAAADLVAAATLGATGVRTAVASAALDASASLVTTAVRTAVAAADLAAAATLSASGQRTTFATAALSADATLAGTAYVGHVAASDMSASAVLSVAAVVTKLGGASLTAAATLAATGVREAVASVSLVASGTLGAAAAVTRAAAAQLVGVASLFAAAAGTSAGLVGRLSTRFRRGGSLGLTTRKGGPR